MGWVEQFVLTLLSSGVVAGCTAAILAFVGKTWLTERLKQSIHNEYAIRQESFRHELKASHELALQDLRHNAEQLMAKTAAAANAFKDVHVAAYQSRLEAVAFMWEAVIALQMNAPSFLIWADIITRDEESRLLEERPDLRDIVIGYSLPSDAELTRDVCHEVEKRRPFLGEQLYAIFFAYRAFRMRVPFVLQQSAKTLGHLSWRNDTGASQILHAVLSKEEMREISSLTVGAFNRASQLLAQKMLNQVASLVSGEASADTALSVIQKIENDTRIQSAKQTLSTERK